MKRIFQRVYGRFRNQRRKRLYDSYCKSLIKEAEKRVGNNICAYQYVIRATRLCRLFSLNAPEIVIKNEARLLAAAMVLHKYCTSKETVDNTYRLQIERYELMSDEELDNLFRPKKQIQERVWRRSLYI